MALNIDYFTGRNKVPEKIPPKIVYFLALGESDRKKGFEFLLSSMVTALGDPRKGTDFVELKKDKDRVYGFPTFISSLCGGLDKSGDGLLLVQRQFYNVGFNPGAKENFQLGSDFRCRSAFLIVVREKVVGKFQILHREIFHFGDDGSMTVKYCDSCDPKEYPKEIFKMLNVHVEDAFVASTLYGISKDSKVTNDTVAITTTNNGM